MTDTRAKAADEAAPTRGPARQTGERVSMLSGDRPCARCGFNLTGQHVIREPHYGMLVVVCPECGAPAALQEYPLLGRWAVRWGALLAAVWVLQILSLLAATVGVSFGFGMLATETSGMKLAQFIAERHREWMATDAATRTPPASAATTAYITSMLQQPASPYNGIDAGWWAAQDPAVMLAASGGWWGSFDWNVLYAWVGASVPLLAAGVVWAVVLSHVRRSRLWLVIVAVSALTGGLAVLVWSSDAASSRWPGAWVTALQVARRIYFVPIIAMTLVAEVVPFFVGLMIGRPLARLMVRAFVPPRLRVPLSFLWLCDGKEPPRAGGGLSGPAAARPAGS